MDKKKIMWWMGGGFSSEYVSLLARGTALGYTLPSAAQQAKQNLLINTLKEIGAWTLIDVLYVYATDGSADFATLNWKAPSSFQNTQVGSPTFTANQGFTFGAATRLSSNWIPGTNGVNYTLNNAGFGGWINSNVGAASRCDFGASNNGDGVTNGMNLFSRSGTDVASMRINDNANLSSGATITTSVGFYHAKRTTSTARALFKNGVSIASDTQVSTSMPTVQTFIGASNGNGGGTLFCQRQESMFWAGASLNGLELSFYNAWNTYFTSL